VNQRLKCRLPMEAQLHMYQAMFVWDGSAVRVEEAFPDPVEQEESDRVLHTDTEGFHKHIPANTRLQLYWHDSNNGQRHVCGCAIEVGEFEIVVQAEKPVPVGTVVVVNTAKSGFVGRASIQRWEPRGFNYRIGVRMLDSHAREL
jgi:hypothetical protein